VEYSMHAWRGCQGCIDIVLPLHLQQDVPSFCIWLQVHAKGQLGARVVLDLDMVRLS
jgi:hypothetical protein